MIFKESPDKTRYTFDIPGILAEEALLHRDASAKLPSNVTGMDVWSNRALSRQ